MDRAARLQRKLKTAAFLLMVGLAVEGISLHWAHPTSFMLFIILGVQLADGAASNGKPTTKEFWSRKERKES